MPERNPHEPHVFLMSRSPKQVAVTFNSILMNSGGLPSGAIKKHHRYMETMMYVAEAFRRSGLATCVMMALAFGISGYEKKEATEEHASIIPASAPHVAAVTNDTDCWTRMESLEPGKWQAIDGASDLDWDKENGVMQIGIGTDLNGVRWTGPMPTMPYTVELEARRMSGSDFFCGLTFPVRNGSEHVSFIVGGWGGNLVGISSIDGLDASENSTASQQEFEDQRWYRIRVQVENERLQAWIDDRQVVDAFTDEQKLSLRPGPIEACAPFGLATWLTSAEVRGVRWRKLGD